MISLGYVNALLLTTHLELCLVGDHTALKHTYTLESSVIVIY